MEAPLGSGAMGTVLLARDPELARPVAIKLVAPGRGGEAAHQRLLREAQAAARLSHPNVVAIHQAGTWRDQVFIVMEYVDGGTLRDWVKETPRRWEDILDAFHQAGQGLLAAHQAGLVHRDFKPDNVLIGRDGRVRVSDFGLVGVEGGAFQPDETIEGDSLELTRTGALVGTPAYMAPEQFEGSRVDARADQFAFAVALYEAFYGKRPYLGTTVTNLLYSMSSGEIQPPPSSHVPRPIYAALLRALAANPEARYPSMAELLAALRREPSSPAAKHGTTLAVGVGAVIVAMGGTAAFFVLRSDDEPAVAVEEPAAIDCNAPPGLEGVWNDKRREALVAAFQRLPNRVIGEAASSKLVAALDRYVQSWHDISKGVCEARVEGTRSEEELALQTACLEDRRAEIEIFLAVLAEEDATILAGALGAAVHLAPVGVCSDLGTLRSVPPPPEDGERRDAVAAVRRQRAHAAILLGAGRYPDALSEAEIALKRAEETGYEPEIVRVQAIVAESNLQLARIAEAEPIARAVVERAASIREDYVEALAWQMVLTTVYGQGRLSDAYTVYESAKVAATRAGDARVHARLLNHAANLAYVASHDAALPPLDRTAKLAEAREKADAAIEAFEALPEPTVGLGNSHVVRAAIDTQLGEKEAARESYARARRVFAETVGEGHVIEAIVLQGEAALASGEGNAAEAAKLYRQAADRYVAVDPHHVSAMRPLVYLSEAYQRLGESGKAEAALEEAVQVGTAADGTMNPGLLDTLQRLGQIAWMAGRWKPAEQRYTQAKDIALAVYGERSLELARCHVQLAIVAQSQGDFEGSVPHAEAGVETTLQSVGPSDPRAREQVAFLGDTYAHLKRCDDAFPRLAQADAIAARNALPEDLVSVQTRIARAVCKLHTGDLPAAERELEQAAAVLPSIAYPGPMAPYLESVRARLLLEQGKPDEASGAAQIARDGFVALGTPYAVFAEEMRELIARTSE